MISLSAEWLEADGLGGFAFGRADGIRTRRYHAVLSVATTPPTGRYVLVNGFDAWVETPDGRFALSSQRYAPDATHPDGATRIVAFTRDPWPTWTYALPNGLEVIHELVYVRGAPLFALSWRLNRPDTARLNVQPYLSGRNIHATHHENGTFRFGARVAGRRDHVARRARRIRGGDRRRRRRRARRRTRSPSPTSGAGSTPRA
jgi:predicted glycogen debranching enzyme